MTISLADVVSQVESGGDSWAARLEPAVYARYAAVDDQTQSEIGSQIREFEKIHNCSPDTARQWLSTSFGLFQSMGFNLHQHVLKFASDPALQIAEFERFCGTIGVSSDHLANASWLMNDSGTDALGFATRYNGPGDPAGYLERLRAVFREKAAGS
jgi:hypothetical protein